MVTRQAERGCLRGVARAVLVKLIAAQGLELEKRSFTTAEAYDARDAFLTSVSQLVLPVVRIATGRSAMGHQGRLRPLYGPNSTTTPNGPENGRSAGGMPAGGLDCRQLMLARTADLQCNGRSQVLFSSRLKVGRSGLAQQGPEAKGPGKRTTTMAADRSRNLRDPLPRISPQSKTPLTIFLVNRVKLQGVVTWFDDLRIAAT